MGTQKWCGQSQPHNAHRWVNESNLYAECAGHSGSASPGPCWADSGVSWPEMPDGTTVHCDLLAGHAGAHQAERGQMGGIAVWPREDGQTVEDPS